MQRTDLIFGVVSLCVLAGCTVEAEVVPHAEGDVTTTEIEEEVAVAIADLPAAVRAAALAAVPGIELEEAEQETEADGMHYCVHGTAAGVFYEVEIAPDGTLLSIEEGDDDEDGEGDDDGDHEDGDDD